jgi:serine/threonine protein kinase
MNDLLGGRYRLGAPLGRGGMGMVYEAVQEGLGRRVAVKLLDPRLAEDREQLERFRREAEVVAALGHPNIVQVTDFQYPEEPGQQPFLVMELLRGESLGSLVERERALPAGRVAFIAAQVLSALVAAHHAGVVHRDIKPDNIFLLGDAAVPDTAKVLDFGIAKLAPLSAIGGQAKLTGTGAMLGTPAFMAPEQARGESDVDARADVYAVGATMYQALTGKLPYEAASIPALLFAIVEQTPAPLGELRPDLPSDFVAVVERAMAKDRAARFPDADAMRRALSPWSGLPASVPPPVSATAATVASGRIVPHDPSTPIVVHQTPAAQSVGPVPPSRPHGRSLLSQILLAVTVLGVAAMGMVVAIVVLNRPKGAATSASASTSAVAGDALTSTLAPPPASVATATSTASASASATTSASATAVATATSAPRLRRYSGATGWVSGGDYGGCPGCDWEAFRHALEAKSAATSACFKASQHEPPHHETPYYQVGVADDGKVTSFRALSDGAPRLDACLHRVVASVPMHMKKPAGGSFKIGFDGPCKRGMENIKGACD